jgi:hypothetical protein
MEQKQTWSVRMTEEMKEKIKLLTEQAGLSTHEFLSEIVDLYELKQSKNVNPLLDKDIDELLIHTARIHKIFVNISEKVAHFQKQREEESLTKMTSNELTITLLHEQVKITEDKNKLLEEEVSILKHETMQLKDEAVRLCETCETQKALTLEYKEKNDTLTGLLAEHKQHKEIQKQLQTEIETCREKERFYSDEINNKNKEIGDFKKILREAETAHAVALEMAIEHLKIQKENEILEVRRTYLEKLELKQDEYSKKISGLLTRDENSKNEEKTNAYVKKIKKG